MSLNKNLKTRRKQLAILAAVIVGGAAATSGVIWYGQHQQEQKHPAPVATPNMTGVVTAAFNQQVNDAALAQQQAKTSALEDKLATLTQQFAQNKLTTEQQLAKKDEEIQRLNDQLTKAPGSNTTTGQQTPPAGQNGTPLPGPVAAGQARPPEYTVTPSGTPAATGVNMGQGAAFYPGGSGQRMTGGLSTTKFSYESLKKKPTKLPWIPSGSFSDAIMIEGADANASVTGQQNTQPVTIRLLGNIQMPNNKEYSADGCFVVGEIWGDISSERGIVRTKSLSCVLKNGKHVDMEFDGHVSYQGKGGVRGKPVMRNGMIVGYAGAAGLLSGFGEGIKSAATPSVGLGATADNAGCGGIDAYLGSFSMISGEEIQRFVKQIMSNAAGYAFDLALQTMVPELKQAKDFLQKLASDVNSMNMSSCQAAQGIIGGLWPVTQVSQQKICQDIAGETNMFSDWAASRQGCTVGGQGDKVTAKAGDAEKDQVLKNKNLIWDTLSKNGLLGNDRALKELVMSTVGSIIFNKNGDVTILTPLVDNRDLIKVLMRGGTAKVYGCDESDLCLGPVVTNLTISESNALVTLVKNLMLSMQNKLVDDTALTDQEKGFVNTTSVPVLKYLTNAQSMGMSATYLLQVSDFIAQDLMIQYLQELVKQASLSLAGKNFPEEAAAKLRDNIIHAQGLLADMKLQSAADQNALDGIDRNMQYLQQQVSTIVSGSYQSNYHWGDR